MTDGDVTRRSLSVGALTRVGHRRLAREPHMELVRRELLEQALAFHERFVRLNDDNPALRRETAEARLRLGEVQEMLGRDADAETSYRAALAALAETVRSDPSDAEASRSLAAANGPISMP